MLSVYRKRIVEQIPAYWLVQRCFSNSRFWKIELHYQLHYLRALLIYKMRLIKVLFHSFILFYLINSIEFIYYNDMHLF